jgi:hypothetical protein
MIFMKKGYIIPNGVVLEAHENKTVVFLTELGYAVELIPPRPTEYQSKTPDVKINGKMWEVKCPRNNGKHTIQHMMQTASKQASNLIVDLCRARAPLRSLSLIKSESSRRSRLKNVIVITKNREVLYIKGSL